MFMSLVDFLREKKIEIPGYHTFTEVITSALRNFEKILIASIEENLSISEKQLIDGLLEFGMNITLHHIVMHEAVNHVSSLSFSRIDYSGIE